MEYTKIDNDSIEQTFKTKVFRKDLLSAKETLEKRLVEVNAMLETLK